MELVYFVSNRLMLDVLFRPDGGQNHLFRNDLVFVRASKRITDTD